MNNRPSFFAELKRRNVYKVAAAYAVVAWLLVQGASIVLPTFEAPSWAMKVLLVALAAGFPTAVILAWAFEITPEGIKFESEVDPDKSITRHTGRKLVGVTIVLAVIAASLLLFQLLRNKGSASSAGSGVTQAVDHSATSAPIPEKSIAVLPFENLSSDKENAYFADGIQDEILTRLSKVASLKVISRTSTQKYKSAPDNLREVGKQLGVANLLEGSVQKIANAAHINVQLIRVATDEHLWAESYNRKLDDVFGVEGEVAGAIAEQLNTKLTGSEKQELAAKPTNNPEAYDAYLRGLTFFESPDLLHTDFQNAVESFETAVRLDANFALAWARLSNAHSNLFFNYDASPARRDAARKTLDDALRLQPDLLESQLAEAYYYYFVQRDYDRARHIFDQIRLRSPNNSEAPRALALIARRQGRWDESLARFHDAIELDPRNLKALMWLADNHVALRQFPTALRFIDRALQIAPADRAVIGRKVSILQAMGRLEEADSFIGKIRVDASDAPLLAIAGGQLLLQHRYPEAIEMLRSYLAKLDATAGLRARCGTRRPWRPSAINGRRRGRESELLPEPADPGGGLACATGQCPARFFFCSYRRWLGRKKVGHEGGRAGDRTATCLKGRVRWPWPRGSKGKRARALR